MNAKLAYRPEIDGLRAISVIAVILFHVDAPGFSGGYLGVDVFFVISGYLITQLLMTYRGSTIGTMLKDFYLRRARRILPALLLVLTVATAIAIWLLLPSDLVRFGKFLGLSAIMLPNIAAWNDGAYFGGGAAGAPLLHLWSIGIEEQFYVAYPLFLLALWRWFPRRICTALAVAALISFAVSVWGASNAPVANFYLAPSRAWELLIGALVGVSTMGRTESANRMRWLTTASFGALICSFILYGDDMRHPGIATLVPTLATAGILWAGGRDGSLVSRLLATRPVAFTGLISYSLYLWHLPLLVFATYYNIGESSALSKAGIVALSFILAVATWKFVENPFRRRGRLRSGPAFAASAIASLLLFCLGGAYLARSEGLPTRLDPSIRDLLASAELHRDAMRCVTLTTVEIEAGNLCRYGSAETGSHSVLAWGDSHAMALLPAYEELAERYGVTLYFAGISSCRPVTGAVSPAHAGQGRCDEYNQAMFDVLDRLEPDVVILASYWAYPDLELVGVDGTKARLKDAVSGTLQRIAAVGSRACVVLDVPVMQYSIAYALAMRRRLGLDETDVRRPNEAKLIELRQSDEELMALADGERVLIIDPKEALCPTGDCEIEHEGKLLYRDTNHLTVSGSRYVSSALVPCFEAAQ